MIERRAAIAHTYLAAVVNASAWLACTPCLDNGADTPAPASHQMTPTNVPLSADSVLRLLLGDSVASRPRHGLLKDAFRTVIAGETLEAISAIDNNVARAFCRANGLFANDGAAVVATAHRLAQLSRTGNAVTSPSQLQQPVTASVVVYVAGQAPAPAGSAAANAAANQPRDRKRKQQQLDTSDSAAAAAPDAAQGAQATHDPEAPAGTRARE